MLGTHGEGGVLSVEDQVPTIQKAAVCHYAWVILCSSLRCSRWPFGQLFLGLLLNLLERFLLRIKLLDILVGTQLLLQIIIFHCLWTVHNAVLANDRKICLTNHHLSTNILLIDLATVNFERFFRVDHLLLALILWGIKYIMLASVLLLLLQV